jgi:uncharacterized membrane protein YfcA
MTELLAHLGTGAVSTLLGARLAHYLPKAVLQRIFAQVLVLIGLRMVSA